MCSKSNLLTISRKMLTATRKQRIIPRLVASAKKPKRGKKLRDSYYVAALRLTILTSCATLRRWTRRPPGDFRLATTSHRTGGLRRNEQQSSPTTYSAKQSHSGRPPQPTRRSRTTRPSKPRLCIPGARSTRQSLAKGRLGVGT